MTALAAGPLVILVILFGGRIGLFALILLATGLGLSEFYRLALPTSPPGERVIGIVLGLLLLIGVYFGQEEVTPPAIALSVIVLFVFFGLRPLDLATLVSRMSLVLFGILYVGFLLSYFVLLGDRPVGIHWVLFLILAVWAGDTAAYFTGTLIGRHRLYPKLSPKKSVEGLVGGIGGSVAVTLIFSRFFLRDLTTAHAVILGVSILLLGQMGDLGESMIKRSANVKDSSRLIPGHGGVLDRLDSFLFTAPFLYYYVQWLQK